MHLSKLADSELRDALQVPNFGLLSCCATYLRKRVSRRSHMSGTVLFPQSFTVHDLRTTLHACFSMHEHSHGLKVLLTDAIVSSLELQSFFYNGSWKNMAIASDDDVCIFMYCDEDTEPPTGVFPALVKCYSPTCEESGPCYSPSCPNKTRRRIGLTQTPHGTPQCYSPTCEQGRGCYSPTCPHRYLDPPDDKLVEFFIHESPLSSNGPPTPTSGPSITWIDHCRPCSDRPRRSLSSYLMGFPTEDALTNFWIGAAGVR